MQLLKKTANPIYHLAHDEYIPGNFLFSCGSVLYSMNFQGTITRVIGMRTNSLSTEYREGNVSNAIFSKITSFIHLSRSQVLLIDHYNNVLRTLNRTTDVTSLMAGFKHDKFTRSGLFSHSRFNNPVDIATNDNNKYYISQPFANAIAVLNMKKRYVTHVKTEGVSIRSFSVDWTSKTIYACTNNQIAILNPQNLSITPLNPKCDSREENCLFTNGLLANISFDFLSNIVVLNTHTLLALEKYAKRIKVVDLSGKVSTICSDCVGKSCSRSQPSTDKDVTTNCSITGYPLTGLKYNSTTVLIGSSTAIMALSCKLLTSFHNSI